MELKSRLFIISFVPGIWVKPNFVQLRETRHMSNMVHFRIILCCQQLEPRLSLIFNHRYTARRFELFINGNISPKIITLKAKKL